MAKAGQILDNPVSGMRMEFVTTANESGGRGWEVIYTVQPGWGKEVFPHTHIKSNERFEILEGSGRFSLNNKEYNTKAGDIIEMPMLVPHQHPWNTGSAPLKMRNIVEMDKNREPDLEGQRAIESMFVNLFGLARDGKVNKKGEPNLFQVALFLKSVRSNVVLPNIPVPLQAGLFAPLAYTGKLLGYKTSYAQYDE
jgi:mannose-6-phosphate isomerase-like protein (cupin superfamily)